MYSIAFSIEHIFHVIGILKVPEIVPCGNISKVVEAILVEVG